MNSGTSRYEFTEALSETPHARVYRGRHLPNGPPVIFKISKREAATRDGGAHFRHEFDIISRARLPGIIKALGLEDFEGSPVLVLEDIGGTSLDRLARGAELPLDRFLDLAVGLASTLGGLHHLRILHQAICPAHIVLNPATGQFRLIGFGLADELPQVTVPLRPPTDLEEMLDYLSPEQTGRMNRSVDYRSDFYSLGVTFYRLLTGREPFEAEDALGLIHCHIAKIPTSPHEVSPAIPAALSNIVLKLMAKTAEDRYQSAWGLQADLERCRRGLREHGTIPEFELGREDVADQLRMPEKPYGREAELEQLLHAFERVCAGERELQLVAGYAGVGKTTLVHETHRTIAERRGRFVEGKFDQLQRNIPYFAWIQAFTELANSLLMENEARLAQLKQNLLKAVGSIGRVLTDVIPNLELILGTQPPTPELTGIEAQNRFNYVVLEFLKAIATDEHPLVIFLDDLQWIDAASLNLLQTLIGSSGGSHLLVIGAYRDNEVDALHPLIKSVESLREGQARIGSMTLQDLSELTVDELISQMLHAPTDRTGSLTRLLYGKTGGNPFFLLQTLRTLVERKAIVFDLVRRGWRWELPALERTELTDNVVTLMVGKIQQLPPETQQALRLAACMGFRFDLANLGVIEEQSEAVVRERLKPALWEGLTTLQGGSCQFAHDRIQQAAYSLIPEADKKEIHLRIGRLMQEHLAEQGHEDQLLTLVNHLNLGADLLSSDEERLDLARLNLRAGVKAKASAAFSAAARFFDAGVALLDDGHWATHYDLMLQLHALAAETASLVGDFAGTDQLFDVITRHARNAVDMAGAYESRMHCHVSQGRVQEVLDVALEILARLGLSLPPHPTADEVARVMDETRLLYADIPIESFLRLPAMTDSVKLAIVRITSKATAAAYLGRPSLNQLFCLVEMGLYLRHGNAVMAPYTYAGYAHILCELQQDYDAGYRFSKLAVELLDATDNLLLRSKTLEVVTGHVWHFKQHLRTTLPYLEDGYQSGLEAGDLEYAGYNAFFFCCHSYFAGADLRRLEQRMSSYDESLRRIRAETARRFLAPYWQGVQNLLGMADDPCRLTGRCFDQEEMLPLLRQSHHVAAVAASHVNRLILCYLFGDYPQARESAESAAEARGGMLGMFSLSVTNFYDSLTHLRLYPRGDCVGQTDILERVSRNQEELRRLADHAPMNQLHRFHLVEAERLRVTGQDMAALDHYDTAISLAAENEYVQDEALANELAARFWLDKGKANIARIYMEQARDRYESWGAARKVRDLTERYSSLLGTRPVAGRTGAPVERLDLSTMMKATQAISSEIELDRLLSTVLQLAIENAGAQTGALVLSYKGEWVVAARVTMDGSEVEIPSPARLEDCSAISAGLVRFVARTGERVVLEDAANEGGFVSDPHIREGRTKSLLCAPLLSRGRQIGILYLENNLTSHAFTPERIEILDMLFAPTAAALENARAYQALKESEADYRRIVSTASEGIWVIGADLRTTSVNDRMAGMLGYAPEEILGRPISDFMFEEDLPDHARQMADRRQGLVGHYERRFRRSDGDTVWTIASATPLLDELGHFEGSFGMYADITERKRAEQELSLTRFALDNVQETAFLIDREARFRFVNYECSRTWGFSREELLRMRVADIYPDFPAEGWPDHWRELEEKRSLLFETRQRTRDGHIVPVEVKANYCEYDHEGLNLALARDITERKQGEQAILQLNRDLERRVTERTAALALANRELEAFSYSVSHDLRAPLRHITGFAKLLAEHLGDTADPDTARFLSVIERSAGTMSGLIEDLLSFSRMSRAERATRPVDLDSLLADVIQELAPETADRCIGWHVAQLPTVTGDEAMLRIVFVNLLTNAVKFTRARSRAEIEIGTAPGEPDEVVIFVRDNGIGFDQAYADKIFDVFQRLHGSDKYEGSGIGLANVRRIIARHGGRTWAKGTMNEGATFFFSLPMPEGSRQTHSPRIL